MGGGITWPLSHELPAAAIPYKRSTQDCVLPHSILEAGGTHDPSLPYEGLTANKSLQPFLKAIES